MDRVIALGFDGLDHKILQRLMEQDRLPAFRLLAKLGGLASLGTTFPASTPVAWSTFATGANPGVHGIFDFLRVDPKTRLPQWALTRYESGGLWQPARGINLRRGETIWQRLSAEGIESTVIRCPCSFPPEPIHGRILSGMGVPDIRGGAGTAIVFSTDPSAKQAESERLIHFQLDAAGNAIVNLPGPNSPRSAKPAWQRIHLNWDARNRTLRLCVQKSRVTVEVQEYEWSPWIKLDMRLGIGRHVRCATRCIPSVTNGHLQVYFSPLNFDAAAPLFPISYPEKFAGELESDIGTFHTVGMAEDHTGLMNGRLNEEAFLAQCETIWHERRQMLFRTLHQQDRGFVFCLFDTPDRIQHMFWRYTEPDHPANFAHPVPDVEMRRYRRVIEDEYCRCDRTLAEVMSCLNDHSRLIVLSDHGFTSFRRGVHVNAWLREQGLLTLRTDADPAQADYLRNIDWHRTKAFSVGLTGIYLNREGTFPGGMVSNADAADLSNQIAQQLLQWTDAKTGNCPLSRATRREMAYQGEMVPQAPDILLGFAAGYRASWETAIGATPTTLIDDNTRRWGGDHIIDPELVPGILGMNVPFRQQGAHIVDLAKTVLASFGVPPGADMEGNSLCGDSLCGDLLDDNSREVQLTPRGAREQLDHALVEPRFPSEEVVAEDEDAVRQRLSGLGYL